MVCLLNISVPHETTKLTCSGCNSMERIENDRCIDGLHAPPDRVDYLVSPLYARAAIGQTGFDAFRCSGVGANSHSSNSSFCCLRSFFDSTLPWDLPYRLRSTQEYH